MANLKNLGLIAAMAAAPFPALAHHGSSGQFDLSKTVEFTGSVTRIRLVNPHAYVYFDVTGTAGDVTNVRCELQSGSLLKRNGWSADMFEKGSTISVVGAPDRTDPTTCYMKQITFENGMTATRNSTFDTDGTVLAEQRPTEQDDGTPNIDGNWVKVRDENAPPEGGNETRTELTDAGKKAVEGATSDDNPRFHCQATNIFMDWWMDEMVNRIEQTSTEITMDYGFMDMERTIHLDGQPMPEDYTPGRAGYSTGEWQDGTLVVTTTGFDEGWIMAPIGGGPDGHTPPDEGERPQNRPEGGPEGGKGRGGPPPTPMKNSTEMVVTERFTLNDDGTVLHREYTMVDPLYLQGEITGSDDVTLTTDPYEPYDCDDLTNERSH
ncbi:DUF6152 family protein [Falsirhodobacter sp. alg1]|uniref:DUF6152 family protein n=1 Tax=Falsirhodobacter sp. alg1 TaxID=1472418 RepID=UPI000694568B|nr:DUF6152 family protein [Falsirhodobacter sp. alg1]